MNMINRIAFVSFLMSVMFPCFAEVRECPYIREANVRLSDNRLVVMMDVDIAGMAVKGDRELWLYPEISCKDSVVALRPVVVASRARYWHLVRNVKEGNAYIVRAGVSDRFEYTEIVGYEDWMEKSRLVVREVESGCGACGKNEVGTGIVSDVAVMDFSDDRYVPDVIYVRPSSECVKTREVRGVAYVDFKVNGATVIPEYRNNAVELAKIADIVVATSEDPDTEIRSLSMRGYASPDGPYEENARLARERTGSLKEYVTGLYPFAIDSVSCSWVAEDWDGLCERVKRSRLDGRDSIVSIIGSGLAPDIKEKKIREEFPKQYRYIAEHFYPSLRRTEYVIEYVVRSYSDVVEIGNVLMSSPQKLSLQELFLLAGSLDPGSEEFKEVFEVAVRMYPDDPVANLNAANTAMVRGDLRSAARYLAKAGDSPEAEYARGVYEELERRESRKNI